VDCVLQSFEEQIGQAASSASKGGIMGMLLPVARVYVLWRAGRQRRLWYLWHADDGCATWSCRASLGQQAPFPWRLGQPKEYAFLVQHIVENRMIYGETIGLDGAIQIAPR
jgi:hypothetical protein